MVAEHVLVVSGNDRRHIRHAAIAHFDIEPIADFVQAVMWREMFSEQS